MIEVGDFIRAYHKGIHEVTNVSTNQHLIHYVKRFNVDMSPSRKIKNACDLGWCKKVSEKDLEAELIEIRDWYHYAIDIVGGENGKTS